MAKTLRTIGTIAGAVALIATGVGAVAGAGTLISVAGVGSATLGTIGTVASVAATAASIGAQALSKAPPVRGNVTQLIIAPDVPQPYMMGEGYYAGVLRHDAAYGATLNDVPNPYRGMVVVYSGGGPVESITPYVDKAAVSSYYDTYLYTDTQLGATPEAAALSPNFAGLPGWDASSKLSGQAAILWNLKFDKKGKRFASGVPQIGAYGQWVKAYDPRLDSTAPGGAGAHRVDDETTWEWTDNPALHFGTYAYGRHQNGVRTMGCGLTSIDWGVIAAWANVCEANGWTIFGVVYEPGNRWENLKDIAAAGGGVPVVSSGGMLSVKYWAPQVALDTITVADIAEGQITYSPLQSWNERVNTIIPRYTSADHEWNQVAAEPVSIAGFVTEDGEEKRKEWPYNLVKDAEQAAQLAAYKIYEGREITPIVIPCLPRMRDYRPGECLTLDLPDYGLEMDAVILQRSLDPATLTVTLTLMGETPAKHAIALGQTPAPPATPVAGQDGEDRDETTYDTGANPPRTVADEAALLALDVPVGTVVNRLDNGQTYFYNGGTSGTIADWTLIGTTMLTGDLNAIEALTGTGLVARTADDTWALRTLTAPAAGLTIANPAGVADNPTFALANDLAGVEGLSSNGLAVRTASDTWAIRTIAGTANQVTLTNGDGVSGNPTVSLPSAITAPGSLVVTTTLGVNGNTTLGDATSDAHTINGGVSNLVATNVRTVTKLASSSLSDFTTAGAALTFSRSNGSNDLAAIYAYTLTGGTLVNLALAARADVVIATGSGGTYDAAVEAMRITSGGALQMGGANTVVTAARLFQLRSYTVATLPAVGDALLAYASDGRKVGEGAGAGTGVPVYRDGGTWFRYGDDTAVAA